MSLYVRVPHPRVKSRRKSAPALNFRPALAPRADSMSPSPMFVDNTTNNDISDQNNLRRTTFQFTRAAAVSAPGNQ